MNPYQRTLYFLINFLLFSRPVLEALGNTIKFGVISLDSIILSIVMVCVLFILFVQKWKMTSLRIFQNKFIFISSIFFTVTSFISSIYSINTNRSIVAFVSDMFNIILMWSIIIMANEIFIKKLITSFFAGTIMYAIDTLITTFVIKRKESFAGVEYFRNGGYFTNTTAWEIGTLMLFAFYVCILKIMLKDNLLFGTVFNLKLSKGRAFLFLLIFISMIATGSRSAMFSIPIFMIVLLFNSKRKVIVYYAFGCLLFIGTYSYLDATGYERILNSFNPDYYKIDDFSESTVAARVLFYTNYFLNWDMPFFGYGQRTFDIVSRGFVDPGSLYTNLWTSIGPVGFFIFILLIFSILNKAWKYRKNNIGLFQIALILSMIILNAGESALVEVRATYFFILQGILLSMYYLHDNWLKNVSNFYFQNEIQKNRLKQLN